MTPVQAETSDGSDEGPWPPERRRNAGRASFNRALGALAIAAAGYLLGFLIPLASSGNSSMGRVVFFPIGGFVSAFMALSAIMIGTKVRKTVGNLTEVQRSRAGTFIDIDKQVRLATAGIVLGIVSIILNPLIGFALWSILR